MNGGKKEKKEDRTVTIVFLKTKVLPLFICFNFGHLIFNFMQTTNSISFILNRAQTQYQYIFIRTQ